MASRSLFLVLRGNRSFINGNFKSIPFFNEANVSNYCTHGALRSEFVEESSNSEESNDLKSRIFMLRLPKRSATTVLQRFKSEGNHVSITELRKISKELRRIHRYKHALEISEWMVSQQEFELSDSDFAIRIDLMTKVFGIDAAERYFEDLPSDVKTGETYTALLHSYAGSKLTEKAEKLYEKLKESSSPLSALPFNEMMTLYLSVGQVEKVSSIVDDLKQRMVHPDIFTYNLWISSFAAALNVDGVRRVLDEMNRDSNSNEDWVRYINLVNIYVKSAHLLQAGSSSIVESESGITQREWITYDFLLILYAGLGNKDKIDQIWKSLRMTKQKMTSRNYVCVLSSYLMLDHLKDIGEVIDQWKQSSTTDFDVSACQRLLNAFLEAGLNERANNFLTLTLQKPQSNRAFS